MPHSMLNFPENEGDRRNLNKVQELLQHFCEQCRHYAPKQNIAYSHRWKFEIEIMKKRKGKKNNCSLYKSETNLHKMLCGLMWYVGQYWEKCDIYKSRRMDKFINVSHVFIND